MQEKTLWNHLWEHRFYVPDPRVSPPRMTTLWHRRPKTHFMTGLAGQPSNKGCFGLWEFRIGKLLFGGHSSKWKSLLCSHMPKCPMPNAQLLMINYRNNLFGLSCMLWFNFYPWFKFYFPLFWGMVLYDNELETTKQKKIKFKPRIKIEPQHIHSRKATEKKFQ